MTQDSLVCKAYELAKERYQAFGVDADAVVEKLAQIPISVQCWQGDDIGGYEKRDGAAGGGILATGNYPGKARTADELRQDVDKLMELVGGKLRFALHAIYLEADYPVDRREIKPEHFANWTAWAKERGIGLDFNPTFFAHPMAAEGFTLSSPNDEVRKFWIDHAKACRVICDNFGRELGTPCVMNTWIPDGFKDIPVDRRDARARLKDSLDQIFAVEYSKKNLLDSVECKLFGIGMESCTVGSHEFYMNYAKEHNLMLTIDSGHFHPTEQISDKISSILLFFPEMLLHISRPIRWDSDHVVIFDDELQHIANETIRNDVSRIHIGMDYFDATINRLAAWAIGYRNIQKALCKAMLEPFAQLRDMELAGDYTGRLAVSEELKAMPWQAVFDFFCLKNGVPVGNDMLAVIRDYEKNVQLKRV